MTRIFKAVFRTHNQHDKKMTLLTASHVFVKKKATFFPASTACFSVSLLFLCALFLSSCGSYSGSFDCPIGKGLHCASLSEVNDKIDHNRLNVSFPSESLSDATPSSCQNCRKIWWRSDLTPSHLHHRKGR